MEKTLTTLVQRLANQKLRDASVIPWSCPVPSFGNLSRSRVATLGLNPSNREFVDESVDELDGDFRRFHTLKSLGISRWSDAGKKHLHLISESCSNYFFKNPYDTWFKRLDYLMGGTSYSYYNELYAACHLDLIPYATACKWTELSFSQRDTLMEEAGDTLGLLLKESPVKILILNGNSVVQNFEAMSGVSLAKESMSEWSLPRRTLPSVNGYAYKGVVKSISGISLPDEILVLGYNHNIQSSFGVTKQVTLAIRNWITESVEEATK